MSKILQFPNIRGGNLLVQKERGRECKSKLKSIHLKIFTYIFFSIQFNLKITLRYTFHSKSLLSKNIATSLLSVNLSTGDNAMMGDLLPKKGRRLLSPLATMLGPPRYTTGSASKKLECGARASTGASLVSAFRPLTFR